MFRVRKAAYIKTDWGNRKLDKQGRVVEIKAVEPTEKAPTGKIVAFIGRRLTPGTMQDRRTFAGLSMGWINEFRDKRLLITELHFTPSTAILLRDALNHIIEKAEIEDIPEDPKEKSI